MRKRSDRRKQKCDGDKGKEWKRKHMKKIETTRKKNIKRKQEKSVRMTENS